jgi:hypothetical protein
MTKRQAKTRYAGATIAAIERSLSTDRLNSYEARENGSRSDAVILHERNTQISEALYGIIQGLEITLRNRIHQTLQAGIGSAEWYNQIGLKEPEEKTLQFAIKTINECHKPLTPSRVIAQLNFGFWVKLTSGPYEKALWVPHLHKIFPPKTKRNKVNQRLNKIKDLRNKIAHHEMIVDRDLAGDYAEILETISWMCPITSNWIKTTNRFDSCFTTSSNGLLSRFWQFVSALRKKVWRPQRGRP